VTLQLIQTVSSFKCYVCAPEEGKPEDMYTLRKSFPTHDIQSCSAYSKSRRQLYLLECPHGGSNGCLTKFEANGSVMRTCAPIAFDDCRKANGINYCYCKKEGCNTPERRLQSPDKPEQVHKHSASSLGQSQAAARVAVSDKSFTRFFDDEDMSEGSGDWGDFYYDDYNYGYYPSQEFDDSEPGLGGRDDEDITEPPPFLDLEQPVHEHEATHRNKFDRGHDRGRRPERPGHADATDITLVEDTESSRPSTGGARGLVTAWSQLLPCLLVAMFLSELLVRT